MLLRSGIISFLAILLSGVAIAADAEEQGPLVGAVLKCPAIFLRQQKDPRISLHEEKLGGKQAVHAYLTLKEPQPYAFSLGWLTPSSGKEGPVCIDEFEQDLSLPGEKQPKGNKPDAHEIKGIDLVSDGKLHPALKEFEDAVKEPQSSARFYNNLAACLAALGEYDKADKQLELAQKMSPDLALAVSNQACLKLSMGKADEALAAARKALQMDPTLRSARFAAVKALLSLGQVDGALKVSEDTVKRWPGDSDAVILSGEALEAKGDWKAARTRYQKALLLLPNDTTVLLKIAAASQAIGDLDDAMKKARQVTGLMPNLAEGHLALGRYLEMNRDQRAAQLQYERALDLDPPIETKVAVFGPYLRVLIAMAKMDEADKLSRKWLKDNQDNADCHFNRAWIAAQLPKPQQKAEAIDEYRKALALQKDLVQAHYNLALLLVNAGKTTEAASELKAFIQQAPHDPDIANARKLLAQLGK